MEKLVFGYKKPSSSMSYKLIVCNETKQYERGQVCINYNNHIDVWISKKEMDVIEASLKASKYSETSEVFNG